MKRPTHLLFALLVLVPSVLAAESNTLMGEARLIKNGELIYTETHSFSESAQGSVMTTSYRNANGGEVANRTVHFVNDRVANFKLQLNNIAYQESAVRRDNGIEITVKEPNKSAKTALFETDDPAEVVIDAGFNNFLLRHWDDIEAGKTLKFDFASTAAFDVVRLQISKDKKLSDENRLVISMTAANAFFRMLMKPVKAGYYRDTRQLAYYRGVSNLLDDKEKAYQVEIIFANGQHTN